MTTTFKIDALLHAILTKGATPAGFAIADRPEPYAGRATHNRCTRMELAGKLFRARAYPRTVRFFSTLEARDAFAAAGAQRLKPPKATKPAPIVIRKPYSPPAPRFDAVVVDGPNVIRSYRPMPDRHAVSVIRQKIGTASWVAL